MGKQLDNALRLSQLCKATRQCRKTVMWKDSVAGYNNKSLLKNKRLLDEIRNDRYKLSPYVRFKVYEPKERDIHATRIRDRVFQRSMINNGVYRDMTAGFIYDNGACLVGKGMDHAVRRTTCFLQRYCRENGTNQGYAVHLDIHHYFPETPHTLAASAMIDRIKDTDLLPFTNEIINSFADERPPEEIAADPFGARGTGLGSPMSQLVQLAVPDKLDHQIKEVWKMPYYIRYMDDFLLICKDRERLEAVVEFITAEMAKMGLEITNKGGIFKLEQGVNFLKLRFILTDTGKVIIRLSHKAISKERKQLRNLKTLLGAGKIDMTDVEHHYQSWIAHAKRGNSDGVIHEMDRYYSELFRKKPNYKYTRRHKNHVQEYQRTVARGAPQE